MRNLAATLAVVALLFSAGSTLADVDSGLEAWASGDYETAFKEWRSLAELGDARAQYNLGLLYAHGQYVPQNYYQAFKWYRKAAEKGDVMAQNNLGIMYARGEGVPKDYLMTYL